MVKRFHVLNDGKFGPGTLQDISLNNSNWKAKGGAIDNKKRPEAVYILLSTWVSPILSVVNARTFDETEADQVAIEVVKEFKDEIRRNYRLFKGFFNSNFFIQNSLIFNMDLAVDRAEIGKSQFLELDLHIETVNEIDDNGNPIATKGTGKIQQLHFDQFVSELSKAANNILQLDTFNNSNLVTFRKTK